MNCGMKQASFVVLAIPPSVNHYVRHGQGRHFRSLAADRFLALVRAQSSQLGVMEKGRYAVDIRITLPPGQRGDLDNFLKCALDGLVLGGLIPSDALITALPSRSAAARRPKPNLPRVCSVRKHERPTVGIYLSRGWAGRAAGRAAQGDGTPPPRRAECGGLGQRLRHS